MEPARKELVSVEEYLEGEKVSPVKHEYVRGEVFAMSGVRDVHNIVTGNVFVFLRRVARPGCTAFFADVKLRVKAADAFFYPDVFLTCDPRDRDDAYVKSHASLVVEVLSDSTALYDRGEKFAMYRQLPSLREYLLVNPIKRTAELWRRNAADRFEVIDVGNGDVELESVGATVPAAELYAGLD